MHHSKKNHEKYSLKTNPFKYIDAITYIDGASTSGSSIDEVDDDEDRPIKQ